MKASNPLWKERLSGKMPEALAREVDNFESDIGLRKQGKLDERLFAETRLRRGAYGQRYDNGQRHDGKKVQQFAYPTGGLTKGPHTLWDAPGMQRIKIPGGGLNAAQLESLAELAEEYSDGIAHITTRQDVQLHYVHIDDTPSLMRRLAAATITTREACGNTVRNVTACPYAGVCPDEVFDVTPYSQALSKFLLGHPDCQSFGRKFKPSFSGCAQHACGLANMHDMGLLAVTRTENGKQVRGFALYVGGGLGTVPYQAKLFDAFLPPEELLPIGQAIARVFARLGEKKNRNRARIKFLIHDLGIEKFKELVWEERKTLPPDPRWTEFLETLETFKEEPLHPPGEAPPPGSEAFERWRASNVRPQKQEGYSTVTVTLPLGDITADQMRSLADIVRRFTRETVRTTVEQNFVIRWVSNADLQDIYEALNAAGLGQPGAGTIVDIVSCPGTDTCKLGISSSRGLASELRKRLAQKSFELDEAVNNLHIKVSGCFNSCGQHHVADLGFYGNARKIDGKEVPYYQMLLGGGYDGQGMIASGWRCSPCRRGWLRKRSGACWTTLSRAAATARASGSTLCGIRWRHSARSPATWRNRRTCSQRFTRIGAMRSSTRCNWGVASARRKGKRRRTTRVRRIEPRKFRITHPLHPLAGREFEPLACKEYSGDDHQVISRATNGSRQW